MFLSGEIQRPNSLFLDHFKEDIDEDQEILEQLERNQRKPQEQDENIDSSQQIDKKNDTKNSFSFDSISWSQFKGYIQLKVQQLEDSVQLCNNCNSNDMNESSEHIQNKKQNKYLIFLIIGVCVVIIKLLKIQYYLLVMSLVLIYFLEVYKQLYCMIFHLIARIEMNSKEYQTLCDETMNLQQDSLKVIKRALQFIRDNELLLNKFRIGTPYQIVENLLKLSNKKRSFQSTEDSKHENKNQSDVNIFQNDYNLEKAVFEIGCIELRQILSNSLTDLSNKYLLLCDCLNEDKENNKLKIKLLKDAANNDNNNLMNQDMSINYLKQKQSVLYDIIELANREFNGIHNSVITSIRCMKDIQMCQNMMQSNLKKELKLLKQILYKQEIDNKVEGDEQSRLGKWKQVSTEFREETRKYKAVLGKVCSTNDDSLIFKEQLDLQMQRITTIHQKIIMLLNKKDNKDSEFKQLTKESNQDINPENQNILLEQEENDFPLDNDQNNELNNKVNREVVKVLEANTFDGQVWESSQDNNDQLSESLKMSTKNSKISAEKPQFINEMEEVLKKIKRQEERIVLDTPEEMAHNKKMYELQIFQFSQQTRQIGNNSFSLMNELKSIVPKFSQKQEQFIEMN